MQISKKNIILFYFTVCIASVHAQYVFNNCGTHPAYGDSLTGVTSQFDTAGVTSGNAGANVIWNFSSLKVSSTSPIAHYYNDPVLTLGDSMFSTATLADSSTNGVTSYYKYTSDSLAFLGDYHDQYNYHFVWDPEKESICPLSFGNSFSDYFSGYNFGECPQHHTYTSRTVTYDAYGTLTMAKSTYPVARLKIVEHTLDSALCVPPVVISHNEDTIYMWYNINTGQPVFSWQYYNDTGNHYSTKIVQYYGYSHLPALVTTGVPQLDEQQWDISVYPNPANGVFTLDAGRQKTDIKQIEIYNTLGQKVYSSFVPHSLFSVLDISSQPNGVYFIQGQTDKGSFSQKIIKE